MARALILLAALLALVAPALSGPAAAQEGATLRTDHAASRLVALNDALVPGETAVIALAQDLDEGWHVYWRNPGDSGLPLKTEWAVPDGFAVSEPLYPLPHRLPLGPMVNFGHEGAPVFLFELAVPEDAPLGEAVTLETQAEWLICLDVCIPEAGRLSLTLPVAPSAAPGPDASLVQAALDARPGPAPFATRYFENEGQPGLYAEAALRNPEFFPFEPNLIEPAGRHEVTGRADTRIGLTAGFAYEEEAPETLRGLIVAGPEDARVGYVVEAPRGAAPPPLPERAATAGSLLPTLLFALLGGLILNVMPCVFPVVFMKAASLSKMGGAERSAARRQGVVYTLGVVLSFLALAGVLIALRAGGEQLGWGFQLQNPLAVGLFAVVIFLVGLNLAGVFEVGTSVQGLGQGLTQRGGDAGAFFTGVLAVAVAAPCIGPFLGVPVGYALAQPAPAALLVFAVIGIGLALPYLALSLVPAAGRILPKPGAWMVTFKQALSFAMFATLVWLAWVLSLQAGPQGILLLGIALVLSGLAAWAFGRAQGPRGQGSGGIAWRAVALAAIIAAVMPLARVETQAPALAARDGGADTLPTVAYDEAVLAELRAAGTPVFVDFTAAWCVTCQVNKQTVLKRDAVVAAFRAADARYMVADWTVQDPVITAALERHGRSGVPLYLWYAPGAAAPEILPQVLSVEGVLDRLEAVGAQRIALGDRIGQGTGQSAQPGE